MKVLFVVNGDARTTRPWSGVPYRILREMESMGIEVVNVDMSQVWHLKWPRILYNRVIRKIVRRWRNIPYEATLCCMWQTNRWLRRVVRRHADCDLVLITSFCVDCSGVALPCVLLHDWTVGYARKVQHGNTLSRAEANAENNQLSALGTATKAVTLYPCVVAYLKAFGLSNVDFVCNPVNADWATDVPGRAHRALRGKRILVVGGRFYRDNLEYVLEAADALGDSSVTVDVVGASETRYSPRHARVRFHGYLNRSDEGQRKRYEELFSTARCLVNIKKGWGGGSSIAEAMYAGLPVICGNYADIVALYGEEARFGAYCEPGNVQMLTEKLRWLLSRKGSEYVEMCHAAHDLVKNDTYRRLVSEALDLDGRPHSRMR